MTHISELSPSEQRPRLILLAVWRASGAGYASIASKSDTNAQLASLGQDPLEYRELSNLLVEDLIFEFEFEEDMSIQLRDSTVPIAEEVERQVSDPMSRKKYLRAYLLDWIYGEIEDRGQSRAVLNKLLAQGLSYYGAVYTEDDIRRAAEYLEEKVWIHGLSGSPRYLPMQVRLTPHGRAKAEGEPEFDSAPTHTVNHTYNNSNVAINSTNVTQSIDSSVHNGEGIESLLYLVKQWMEEVEDDAQRQAVTDAVADVQAAVGDEDKTVLRRSMEGLGKVVRESAVGAAGQAGGTGILMGIQYALQVLGVG